MIVKRFSTHYDWGQAQLAGFSGLNIRTIQRIEKDQKASIETFKCTASVFDVASIFDIAILIKGITVIDKKPNNGAAYLGGLNFKC